MEKKFKKIVYLIIFITLSFVPITQAKYYGAPQGGYAIFPEKPIWLSGIRLKNVAATKQYPKPERTDHLEVVNAGLWLANNGPQISVLVYSFELNIERKFAKRVYTKAILTNPANPDAPFIYEHYLDRKEKSTRINHNPVVGIKKGKEYHFIFEIFEDKKRRKLIERIDQKILSPVDNTSGCVVIEDKYKMDLFGKIKGKDGKFIPLDKIVVACEKYHKK